MGSKIIGSSSRNTSGFVDVSPLRRFPEIEWREAPTERWLKLCDELRDYPLPTIDLKILEVERKWELVSAYQKAVRRGLSPLAGRLVGGFMSFEDKELSYFWRRVCTTACEDVGFGDIELMNFVIACSALITPKVGRIALFRVWSFLTEKMCLAQKSRIYCQLSIIEGMIKEEKIPKNLDDWEKGVLTCRGTSSQCSHKEYWAEKNNWRGEGMLKFQNRNLSLSPHQAKQKVWHPKEHKSLAGFPDFCYDMHTRVGKGLCIRMSGYPIFKEYFLKHPVTDKAMAIGWALFLAEGGLIESGLIDSKVSKLEMKFVALKMGWSVSVWIGFFLLMVDALAKEDVNRFRTRILSEKRYR